MAASLARADIGGGSVGGGFPALVDGGGWNGLGRLASDEGGGIDVDWRGTRRRLPRGDVPPVLLLLCGGGWDELVRSVVRELARSIHVSELEDNFVCVIGVDVGRPLLIPPQRGSFLLSRGKFPFGCLLSLLTSKFLTIYCTLLFYFFHHSYY